MALDLPSYLLGKSKGGGGGTSDYSALENKPQINGVTLVGNKSAEDLGISAGAKIYYVNYYSNYDTAENKAKLKEIYTKLGESTEGITIIGLRGTTINTAVSFYKFSNNLYIDFAEIDYNNGARLGATRLSYNNSSNTITQSSENKDVIIDLNSAQTISGKKTFTTLPESSVVPTTDNQFVNKKYIDDIVPIQYIIVSSDYNTVPVNTSNTNLLTELGLRVADAKPFDFILKFSLNNQHCKLAQYIIDDYQITYKFFLYSTDAVGTYSELYPATMYDLTVIYSDVEKTTIATYYLSRTDSFLVATEFEPAQV